ncbi:bifunctional CBS domain superfamily/CBS domain/Ancient conserved domain protein family/CNNM [Babesia duncani]|uniref:Bifunctional CBS domain superfamily/CBS domain/Ancient conserved domain protein family/CNNM n=1 Tax=Babesia duncani TaxID=323732 RepID=A0AAD9UMY8_9APIC|nr:bifunctional CBS domain superfamily/CBS domain/Ancient conserved domain protein family/CNNM [Babesia duncani]
MSLDLTQLQSLSFAEPKSQIEIVNQKRAKAIYRIRKDPNLLLTTLIFTNSMVNAAMVLFFGDLLDVTWGFVVSTLVTAIFGEIAPQSLFVKHALLLCWLFWRVVFVLEILLYPITKPLALLLNWLVGTASQGFYTKQQLKAFVDVQLSCGKSLSTQEAQMLKGCLECSSVCAEMIMTPMEDVFYIEHDTPVTRLLIDNIARHGFSKIPVVDKSKNQCVIGLVLAKDLLLLNLDHHVDLGYLLETFNRTTFAVDAESGILDLINHFKGDSTHVAIVRKSVHNSEFGDPIYKHVGIVTMDDVIEVILQESMEDLTERGLLHKDLIIQRYQKTSEKWQRLARHASKYAFTLDRILDSYSLEKPQFTLELLGMDQTPENLELLTRAKVYRINVNTCLPRHPRIALLRGTLGNMTTKERSTIVAPALIDSRDSNSCVDYITMTTCDVIQLDGG